MPETGGCKFCKLAGSTETVRFGSVFVLSDGYPVTDGHALIIPRQHRETYFELTEQERHDTHAALMETASALGRQGVSGFNIGWNCGEIAGQTVMHAHCHLIPRRQGDVEDPAGGVRGVIPEKQRYNEDSS